MVLRWWVQSLGSTALSRPAESLGDSPLSRTSRRERLSSDSRARRGAWSFLTRSHRSSVRSSRPVWPSSSCKTPARHTSGTALQPGGSHSGHVHSASPRFSSGRFYIGSLHASKGYHVSTSFDKKPSEPKC